MKMFCNKEKNVKNVSVDNTSKYFLHLFPGSHHTFTISSYNVRDEIIKNLQIKFPSDKIVKKIIEHMEKFDKKSLNGVSEFSINLVSLGMAKLIFNTSCVDGEFIDYNLDKFTSDPPYEYQPKKSFFTWLFSSIQI